MPNCRLCSQFSIYLKLYFPYESNQVAFFKKIEQDNICELVFEETSGLFQQAELLCDKCFKFKVLQWGFVCEEIQTTVQYQLKSKCIDNSQSDQGQGDKDKLFQALDRDLEKIEQLYLSAVLILHDGDNLNIDFYSMKSNLLQFVQKETYQKLFEFIQDFKEELEIQIEVSELKHQIFLQDFIQFAQNQSEQVRQSLQNQDELKQMCNKNYHDLKIQERIEILNAIQLFENERTNLTQAYN